MQNANLIPSKPFWRDYLNHILADQKGESIPFLSEHLDMTTGSSSEALFALAVLGLPLQSKPIYPAVDQRKYSLTPEHDCVAYLRSIEQVESAKEPVSILIGQDIYLVRPQDSSQSQSVQDKPMFIHVPYKANVVVTNPSSVPTRVQVLFQIPQGAIPLASGKATKSVSMELAPYSTQQISYEFYFPKAGKFSHYGAQVANDSGNIASAKTTELTVLDKPENVDQTTWTYIAAWGTDEQVLQYLDKANLFQIDLSAVAWRMQDAKFFDACLDRLEQYGRYDQILWAYSLKHNSKKRLKEFLESNPAIVQGVGAAFQSDLVTFAPVER